MNTTCENSSTDEFSSFNYSAYNNTMVLYEWDILVVNIMTVLLGFPVNFYVIWLIVRGTGNGLAAEIFILNFSICEIFSCMESLLVLFAFEFVSVWKAVAFLDGFSIGSCPVFQCLICVERYLAVVHPVTFLKFKPLRYRLMCCAVAWVICFASCMLIFILTQFFLLYQFYFIFYCAQFFLLFFIQLYCCSAVLRALKQSGPGERGREREEENHMKRRAFHLILITTVATVLVNAPEITLVLLNYLWSLHSDMVTAIGFLSSLFAGLVQPLLFLYRVGKLNFMKCQ